MKKKKPCFGIAEYFLLVAPMFSLSWIFRNQAVFLRGKITIYSSFLWSLQFLNLGNCNLGQKVTIPVLFVLPRERGVEKLWFLIRFIRSSISGLHRNIHSSSFFIIKGILIKTVLASWVEWISVPTSLVLDIYLLIILPIYCYINSKSERLGVWSGQTAVTRIGSSILLCCWYEVPSFWVGMKNNCCRSQVNLILFCVGR